MAEFIGITGIPQCTVMYAIYCVHCGGSDINLSAQFIARNLLRAIYQHLIMLHTIYCTQFIAHDSMG